MSDYPFIYLLNRTKNPKMLEIDYLLKDSLKQYLLAK